MPKLNIPHMSCGHCVRAITNAIRDVDAEALVNIDLATRTADIASNADDQKLVDALTAAGYPPAASPPSRPQQKE